MKKIDRCKICGKKALWGSIMCEKCLCGGQKNE